MQIASGPSDLQTATILRVLSNYTSNSRRKPTVLVIRGTMSSKWPSGFKGMNLNVKYSLAKTPPHQNLTIEKLTEKFGTTTNCSIIISSSQSTGYDDNTRYP